MYKKRYKMSNKSSKRKFKRSANKINKLNLGPRTSRGGARL